MRVSRIRQHIVDPDHSSPPERGPKQGGVPRHRKFVEGVSRHAGERVERIRFTPFVLQIVIEGSEVGAAYLTPGIGDHLHDRIQI